MKNLLRAGWRFLRIVIAYGIVAGVNSILSGGADSLLPWWLVPIVSAALNAISKFFRDKWKIDVKVV